MNKFKLFGMFVYAIPYTVSFFKDFYSIAVEGRKSNHFLLPVIVKIRKCQIAGR